MATDRAELARLYAGDNGRSWNRIELERPATYWEENAVAARRLTRRAISGWLEPHDRQIVLDAGCGAGALARHLAGLGAAVVGLDVLPRFAVAAGLPQHGLRFVAGDLRERVSPPASYTTLVAQEVLEDYPPEERVGLGVALAEWSARRMILAIRTQSSWGEWADRLAGRAPQPPVDTVALFRGIHLETPYFLTRRESLQRRNYALEIAEFTLTHHGARV